MPDSSGGLDLTNPLEMLMAPRTVAPLSYRQMRDKYNWAQGNVPGVADMDMVQYAQSLNDATGTENFSEGLHPSTMRNLSIGLDRAIEHTGAPEATGSLFKGIGDMVGYQGDAFQHAGEGLPRSLVNMAPMLIPGVGQVLGTLGSAGLAGAHTYGETGSTGQALFSAGLMGAMPAIGGLVSKGVLGNLAAKAGTLPGELFTHRLAAEGANQAAMAVVNEAGHQAQSLASGNGLDLSMDHFVEEAIGQVAFAPLSIKGLLPPDRAQLAAAKATAQTAVDNAEIEAQPKAWTQAVPEAADPSTLNPNLKITPMGAARAAQEESGLTGVHYPQSSKAVPETTLFGEPVSFGQEYDTPEINARLNAAAKGEPMVEAKDLLQPKAPEPVLHVEMPEALDAAVAPALAEPDPLKALTSIQQAYVNVLKKAGVHDVALDNLNDATLQTKIVDLLAEGKTPDEAVAQAVEAVKGAAESAVEARKADKYADNKLVTGDAVAAAKARLAARKANMNMGIDPTALYDHAVILAGELEAYVRNGLPMHLNKVKQFLLDVDPDLNDGQINQIWNQARDIVFPDTKSTEARPQLAAATERLSALPEKWQRALEQARQKFLKSPEGRKYKDNPAVEEALIIAMGNVNPGPLPPNLLPDQLPTVAKGVTNLFFTAAKHASAATFKKEAIRPDKIIHHQVPESEAHRYVEEAMRLVKPYDNEIFVVANKNKRGLADVVVRARGAESLDASRPSQEGEVDAPEKLIDVNEEGEVEAVEPEGPAMELAESSASPADMAAHTLDKATQGLSILAKKAEIQSKPAAEIITNTKSSIIQRMADRIVTLPAILGDPANGIIGLDRRMKGNAAEFAKRAKIMLEAEANEQLSHSLGQTETELYNKHLFQKMQEAGVPFETLKQLTDWRNDTYAKVMHGSTGWLFAQPEVQEMLALRKAKVDRVGTVDYAGGGGTDLQPGAIPESSFAPTVGKFSFMMTAKEAGYKLFRRAGFSKEVSQIVGDRLERIAATIKGADNARVTGMRQTPDSTTPGITISNPTDPNFANLVALGDKIFPASEASLFYHGMVFGHEGYEVLNALAQQGKLPAADQAAYEGALTTAAEMLPDDRTKLLYSYVHQSLHPDTIRALNKSPEAVKALAGVMEYSARTPKEFVATLAGMHLMALSEPGGLARAKEGMIYGDSTLGKFVQTVFKWGHELIKGVKGLFALDKSGFLADGTGMGTRHMHETIDKFAGYFKQLSRTPDEVTDAVKQLNFLRATQPDLIAQALKQNLVPDINESALGFTPENMVKDRVQIMAPDAENNLDNEKFRAGYMPVVQMAELHPKLKPLVAMGSQMKALVTQLKLDLISPFTRRDGLLGKVGIGRMTPEFKEVATTPKLNQAFSELGFLQAEKDRFLTADEKAELAQKYALTPEQVGSLNKLNDAATHTAKIGAEAMKRSASAKLQNLAALAVIDNAPVSSKIALDAGKTIAQVVLHDMGIQPMPGVVDTRPILAGLNLSPEVLSKAYGVVQELAPKHAEFIKRLDSQPHWSPLANYGRYHISYDVQGKKIRGRQSADTPEEFQKLKDRITSNPEYSNPQYYDQSQQSTSGLSSQVVQGLVELERGAFEAAKARLSTEAQEQVKSSYSFGEAIQKELAARGLSKFTQQRKMAPGRELVNRLDNLKHWMNVLPSTVGRSWLQDASVVTLRDPDFVANPSYQAYGKQMVENTLQPTSEFVQKLKNWTTNYWLGGNFSSAIFELAQPLQALPAQLTADGMTLGKGYKLLGKALKEVAVAAAKGRYSDQWLTNQMHKLESNGAIDKGLLSAGFDEASNNVMEARHALTEDPTPWDKTKEFLHPLSHVPMIAKNMYGVASGLTSRVSAMTGLLRAREMGMTDQAAYEYAERLTGLTAPKGDKTNLPVGLYSGKYLPRSVVGVVGTLQNYTLAMTAMMHRLGIEAVRSKSLTSQESKAFAQMVGTQVVLAGALGLPGAGAAVALANQLFPQLEIKKNLKEGVAALGGGGQSGAFISDLALRGAPEAFGTVDTSGRLGLGNLLGVSNYDGVSFKNLFGAPGSVASNLATGVSELGQGNFGQAIESAAPAAIKNMVRLLRAGGDVKDASGDTIYKPSAAEKVMLAAGFTPARVADMREFQTLARQSDEVRKNELSNFYDKVTAKVLDKDFTGARNDLIKREKEYPGEFNASEGLRAVIRKAQDATLPEDPRRGGSRMNQREREDLSRAYGYEAGVPNEVARTQQAQTLRQQMGAAPSMSRNEMMEATIVDDLMRHNPTMTRAAARAQVAKLFSKPSRPAFLPQ